MRNPFLCTECGEDTGNLATVQPSGHLPTCSQRGAHGFTSLTAIIGSDMPTVAGQCKDRHTFVEFYRGNSLEECAEETRLHNRNVHNLHTPCPHCDGTGMTSYPPFDDELLMCNECYGTGNRSNR